MPPPVPETVTVTEAQARRLALARAVDGPGAQALPAAQVERAERDALEAVGGADTPEGPDAKAYLLARAERIVALAAERQPAWLHLEPSPWRTAVAWGLPLLSLAAGALLDRIDNPRQVNLLSPPLVGFLLWNLAVYVMLGVWAVRHGPRPVPAAAPWWTRWRALPSWAGTEATRRYLHAWWPAAAPLEGQRWRRLLHTCAAAWAVGVALSIVVGGLVREYRIGWESTLLDLPQVHAFLRVLFAPVVALLPVEPFGLDELARLHFGSGEGAGRLEARRWVFLYLALLALLVVVPRALLAAWAGWRARRLAAALSVRMDDDYYRPILGRVRPVALRLAIAAAGDADTGLLRTLLRQASTTRDAATILATQRGDTLREAARPDDADAVLLAADSAQAAQAWFAAAHPPCPVLVIASEPAAQAWGPRLHVPGVGAEIVRSSVLADWTGDASLRQAIARVLPAWQAPGVERLWTAWAAHEDARLASAMDMLAGELAQAATDVESLASLPVGVRQLVVREERDAQQAAQREAMDRLVARARERRAATDEKLMALHGLGGALPQLAAQPAAAAFRVQQQLHEPQAGLAGAASGAAIGAAVDLAAGGLTLGAASALGALIGGGAALVAAAWKNRAGAPGVSSVALSDEALDALAREALVRYAAIIRQGRAMVAAAPLETAIDAAWKTGEAPGPWPRPHEQEAAARAEPARPLRACALEALAGLRSGR